MIKCSLNFMYAWSPDLGILEPLILQVQTKICSYYFFPGKQSSLSPNHLLYMNIPQLMILCSPVLLLVSLASKSVLKKSGSCLNPSAIFIKFHSTLKVKEIITTLTTNGEERERVERREEERRGGGDSSYLCASIIHNI